MLLVSSLLALCVPLATVFAGTPCPPRENIYPCNCANIHQSKKIIHTIVNCHRLKDSDVLKNIFGTLRTMQIDQFHLYDSFWEANKLGSVGESKKVLPDNWWSMLKIKEMEIVDSAMAKCFSCAGTTSCLNKNPHTTRFTAINVSSSEEICPLCKANAGNVYPWTSCMKNLKHFHYSHGQLTTLDSNLFAMPMSQLTIVNLTNNKISKIDSAAFKKLVQLTQLDLSHNSIEKVDFIKEKTPLRYLDLSWNSIQTLGVLIANAPYLETLNLQYNEIVTLPGKEWKNVAQSLRFLDLRENPLHCDCEIRWVNGTFPTYTILQGSCASPDEFQNSNLRTASRHLNERCDDEGNIGTRARTKSTPAMIA